MILRWWVNYFFVFIVLQLLILPGYGVENESECNTIAKAALENWDNDKARHAFELCLPPAKKGNSEAQYYIGSLYVSNLGGIKPDETEAFKWMTLSAEQGYASAQGYLGSVYEYGDEKDLRLAIYWYRKAAEQDNIAALLDLGRIYHKGIGTPIDGVEAVRWYERAAEKNISNAIKALIEIYSKGLPGFPPNNERAKYWQQKLHDGNSVN